MRKSTQFGFEKEFSLIIKLNDIEIQNIETPNRFLIFLNLVLKNSKINNNNSCLKHLQENTNQIISYINTFPTKCFYFIKR